MSNRYTHTSTSKQQVHFSFISKAQFFEAIEALDRQLVQKELAEKAISSHLS